MVATPAAARLVGHDDTLNELLDAARCDSVEFPPALANHLPMALTVLDRLGAPPARLRHYAEIYRAANPLVPMPPAVAPVTRENWIDHLGDRRREADYRGFFGDEVAALGIRGAVARYLPVLLPGIAASALHALMRLAYAVLRGDPAEVGTALGYWASCYLPMPRATEAPPETADPAEVLIRVAALPGLRAQPLFDHLWYGIRASGAEPSFAPVVDWLRVDAGTLPRMAATSLALFAGTMDFAALHAVTGTHWIRLVANLCPDPLLPRYFWQIVAALVPAIGFPAMPDADTLEDWRRQPCPDWPDIAAKAVSSDDEHDISLVYSARQEEQIYGDRLYRVVAARRLGLSA